MATSTKPAAQNDIRLSLGEDPGELIAAIAPLLGFRPADSAVLIVHKRDKGGEAGMIEQMVRCDLPPPEFALLAAGRFGPLVRGHAGATVVVIGGGTELASPEFVEALRATFAAAGAEEVHCLWTQEMRTGAPWRCYRDVDCRGVLPDLEGGRVAAVAARAGLVTYSSREASAARLNAADPAAVERRSRLFDEAADKAGPESSALSVEQGFTVVREAIRRTHRGDLKLSDEDVLQLVFALHHTEVRDACLALAVPPRSNTAEAAERLWLTLVRECPPPERAQFGTLLAFSVYLRGDGTFAGMAIDNALSADPGYLMAGLLSRAIDAMLPPERLADLGRADPALDLDLPDDPKEPRMS
ncbi:DUF4192 domain-containing protein [Amycolatopsis magusensis]|uniref:DUF4192 domain-containing protein n=1 Tax=Amycolatopsis magusensis TaxID=882444 RepID=A0ABS4Q4N2_9PSEU|nr:DUF4192 domain-containing protein [Amycolatopsis magusensis]MBP2186069.1 hypothetical protein [Amycolatopsis magusensis]